MINAKNVLLSTTNSLEGWQILDYLGPVSSQVVAGTGIFSDIAASFSDFFGGRSESYRKQLASINKEVMDGITKEAQNIGANCVVGLRIDHDEVSGKGKTMFMVTASGTAVVVERTAGPRTNQPSKSIPAAELQIAVTKSQLLHEARKGTIKWDKATWTFIAKNRLIDFAEYVIRDLCNGPAPNVAFSEGDEFGGNAMAYMFTIPDDVAITHIFPRFLIKGNPPEILYQIVEKTGFMDFDTIIEILRSEDGGIRRRALKLLGYHKHVYNKGDLDKLRTIIHLLEGAFPQTAKDEEQKRTLSRKIEQVWLCECGHRNPSDCEHCRSCYRDHWGFRIEEPSPRKVIFGLRARTEGLSGLLATRN